MSTKHKNHKQAILRRMKIVQGHVAKVLDMIEKDEYCVDILYQSIAVQNALKQIDSLILEHHLATCVPKAMPGVDRKKQKELLDVFKAGRK